MPETHELRLKINAAAARAGAREFVSAIRAIQTAIETLDARSDAAFTRIHDRAKNTGASFKTLASNYNAARSANDRFTESVKRANAALQRQMTLAGQVRTTTPRTTTAASGGGNRAADQQITMQNRVKRAVDDTRLSVERLTTSLMKVGGFQSINEIAAAFARFKKEVSSGAVSAQQLDSAKTKLNSTLKSAQTSLVTLTAKAQENARAEKQAAAATRERAAAASKAEASAKASAAAQRSQNTEAERTARAQLSAAQAMRQAALEAERLKNRLHAIGDTRGVTVVDRALLQLRSSLGGTATTALQARQAMSAFANSTNQVKVSILQAEGAQQRAAKSARDLANAERSAATEARRVESQMRSVAGASNAARNALRDATGGMRGLENAFSATFQVGSAFRTMLGTITFGTFTQQVFAAGAALNQFRVTMEVATGSVQGAAEQMDFVDNMARTLGTNLRTTREDFAKFAVASNLAGVSADQSRDIFEAVSQAMTVMGRGAEDQRLAFLALEQMMSKGTISSEELRRQLGERLPGAVALMARAVGVTTGELQKLLKEGKLASAEVLPKFAQEVRNAFGPGLEQALQRAPAALGRLRNEFEFFLSAVADAGFMDALAQGFNDLTKAMQSGEAADAAKKLGEGLANLATMALDFAEVFITNIDRVAAVTKAVVAGLIVRQVLLLGNAVVTASQRFLLGFATMTGAMEASTIETEINTAATTANNAARAAGTTGFNATKAGYAALLAAQTRSNVAMGASTTLFGRMGVTLRGLGASAAVAAEGIGAASRILVGLAGPIGIAVTALSLVIPLVTGMGDETDRMADQVESALRRAGVAFEDFQNTAESSTNLELNQITQDLDLLAQSLSNFATDNAGGILGYRLALKALNDDIQASDRVGRQAQAAFIHLGATVGASEQELRTMSSTTQEVVRGLIEAALQATETGTGFTELRDAIQQAMRTTPGARDILRNLDDFIERASMAEAAISANRMRLVELYGTSNERALKDFSEMAERVVRTGDGLVELRTRMNELTAETPALADGLDEIVGRTERAMASGMGLNQFRALVIDVFDDTVSRIEAAERASVRAADAAAAASEEFVSRSQAAISGLSNVGFLNPFVANVDQGMVAEVESLIASYREFGNLAEPLQTVSETMSGMTFQSEAAQDFAEALRQQVETLVNSQGTYTQFRQEVEQLNTANDRFDGSALVDALAKIEQNANSTITSLEAYRDSLGENETEARAFIDALIDQVREHANAEAAAYAAEAATYAAAAAAREAGSAGRDGADGMFQLAQAFASISGSGFAAAASIGAEIRKVERQIELRSMNFVDRQAGMALDRLEGTLAEGRNSIQETFNAQLAEGIAAGVDISILEQTLGAERDAALARLEGQRAEYEARVRELAVTPLNNDGRPTTSRGGGGRRGASSSSERTARATETAAKAAERLAKAIETMNRALDDSLDSLEEENAALQFLASGFTTSERAARILAAAQQEGVSAFDAQTMAMVRQIEAAERLNDALTQVANDPVNDWMNSVPTWREAGQQIEVGVLNHLSDAIANFIKTGEFSFEALGEAILGTVADIMADMAVKELVSLLGGNVTGQGEGGFGLGGLLSNLFGNNSVAQPQGDPLAAGFQGGDQGLAMQQSIVTGSQQGAETMRLAIVQAGQQVGQSITTGGQTAATTMQTGVQTGGTVAGTQMNTQTTIGGTVAATQMNTQTTTGGTVAATQMQQAIISGGNVAASQMAQASAGSSGGGLFGGGLGGILLGAGLGLLGSLFSKKNNEPSTPEGPVTPVGIRQFAEGTPNTSGIPAVLHDNEAVIPLSRGRKVPVEFGDSTGPRGGSRTVVQNFNITTPDADSFRKSQKQIAHDAASSGQKALADNG